MANKKLVALLVAISTISAISALYDDNCYRGDDGYMHCDDARAAVQEPVNVVGKTGEGLLKIGTLGAYKTRNERAEERRDARERREERRDRYYDYR